MLDNAPPEEVVALIRPVAAKGVPFAHLRHGALKGRDRDSYFLATKVSRDFSRQGILNAMDNSLRHGENVTEIRLSPRLAGTGELILVYEDNGVGIRLEDKERIFERGFGKHTGFGLFLAREILAITGITITENGAPGKGARFEMAVPEGAYRYSGRDSTTMDSQND